MSAPVRRRKVRYGRWALAGSALFHAGLVVLADRYLERLAGSRPEGPSPKLTEEAQTAKRSPPASRSRPGSVVLGTYLDRPLAEHAHPLSC